MGMASHHSRGDLCIMRTVERHKILLTQGLELVGQLTEAVSRWPAVGKLGLVGGRVEEVELLDSVAGEWRAGGRQLATAG